VAKGIFIAICSFLNLALGEWFVFRQSARIGGYSTPSACVKKPDLPPQVVKNLQFFPQDDGICYIPDVEPVVHRLPRIGGIREDTPCG